MKTYKILGCYRELTKCWKFNITPLKPKTKTDKPMIFYNFVREDL